MSNHEIKLREEEEYSQTLSVLMKNETVFRSNFMLIVLHPNSDNRLVTRIAALIYQGSTPSTFLQLISQSKARNSQTAISNSISKSPKQSCGHHYKLMMTRDWSRLTLPQKDDIIGQKLLVAKVVRKRNKMIDVLIAE